MRTNRLITDRNPQARHPYALRRDLGCWAVTLAGQQASFKHQQGASYVAWLLLHPPAEPIHAVALALKARSLSGEIPRVAEAFQGRSLGMDDAPAARALWCRQRALERVIEDDRETEPVKAEALRELEEITEFLRQHPWRSRHGAERCVNAVRVAIKRLHASLAQAVEAGGRPHPVLSAFARHLHEHLLVPSGRGGRYARARCPGCFTYEPPQGVVWAETEGWLPQ